MKVIGNNISTHNVSVPKKRQSRSIYRFTLIELLIVISVIAILMSILLPALKKAKKRAQQIQCVSNLKNLGSAFNMYLIDSNEYFPDRLYGSSVWTNWKMTWMQMIAPYIGMDLGDGQNSWEKIPKGSVLSCPSINDYQEWGIYAAYGYNHVALGSKDLSGFGVTKPGNGGTKLSMIKKPSEQLQHVDSWYGTTDSGRKMGRFELSSQRYVCFRHSKTATTLYVDGHVKPERQDWLWMGHPVRYPWNWYITNKEFSLYSGRINWAAEYGYDPY